MAKNAVHRKPSWSLGKRPFFTGGAIMTVIVCAFWLFADSWPNMTGTLNPILVSDGVTGAAQDCTMPPEPVDLRHDPPNSTFYDDPNLSYSIEKPIQNWDEKRREWLNLHPAFATGDAGGRIIVLTGSQPSPCENPIGDHLLLRLFKNKVDYCRIHGYDIFYSNTFLHPKMRSYWAKLPLVRAAMVAHPEAEWIWWVDSDAVFTDMEFKLPLRRYKDHNLVVHGWSHLIYEKKSWVGLNAGVFLIRNSQWSMNFMQVWASMGPQSPEFEKWGRIQRSILPDKMFPSSDDQSALIYLLLKEKEKWGDKIYIEGEYYFQGYWIDIVGTMDNITKIYARMEEGEQILRQQRAEKMSGKYGVVREVYLKNDKYGKGSLRRPFVTHFTGCQPCNGEHNPAYSGDSCRVGMERALNFADNQVLRSYGFWHPDLMNSSHVSPLPFNFSTRDDITETGEDEGLTVAEDFLANQEFGPPQEDQL